MPVPLEFLRGVLGLLCVFFAHMAGRSAAAVALGRQKRSRLYAWLIRTTVCAAAMLFRQSLDAIAIGVYVLACAAAGLGWWLERRPRQDEDLTNEIFR